MVWIAGAELHARIGNPDNSNNLSQHRRHVPAPIMKILKFALPALLAGATLLAAAQDHPVASPISYASPPAVVYPPESRLAGEEGNVTVKVVVEKDGRASSASVVKSSGFARLDQAAIDAFRNARFIPYMQDGQPLVVATLGSIRFQLHNQSVPGGSPERPFRALEGEAVPTAARALTVGALTYRYHRSYGTQSQFIPAGQGPWWNDMLAISLPQPDEKQAQPQELANAWVGNCRDACSLLRYVSQASSANASPDYLLTLTEALPAYTETHFVRLIAADGGTLAVMQSHRIYGKDSKPGMDAWLRDNQAVSEQALANWSGIPGTADLRTLLQGAP